MPVLESTDEITPRSVLRHRPIRDKTAQSGTESVIPNSTTPVAQRASRVRPKSTDVAEDVSEWQRGEADETRTDRKSATPQQVKTSGNPLAAPDPRPDTAHRRRGGATSPSGQSCRRGD